MELYSSSINQPEIHDSQRYYRTPALGAEDIVCPGSDAEETLEEIRQKRLRYERQARRYLRGHRPLLLSANLRGPFEDWRNPWLNRTKDNLRPVPGKPSAGPREPSSRNADRAIEHNRNAEKHGPARERSKPILSGSVSKASVTKSQLGYVNPAEVLAWQARVDSKIAEESPIGLGQRCDGTRGKSMIDSAASCHTPGSVESKAGPADSMINHYAQTPYKDTSNFTKIPKRAGDSEWLVGSYVSKRARWDGPALSSPTPLPNLLTSKHQARRFTPTSPVDKQQASIRDDTMQSTRTPYLQASNAHHLEKCRADTLFSAQVDDRAMLHWSIPSTGFTSTQIDGRNSINQTSKMEIEAGLDELQGRIHDSKPGSLRTHRIMSLENSIAKDPLFSDLKDTPNIMTSRTQYSKIQSTSRSLRAKLTGYTLPKLPHTNQHDHMELHEDSFVSEVAPSSRDLEQFHFKKRKRLAGSVENSKLGTEERPADGNLSITDEEVPDEQLPQPSSQIRSRHSPVEHMGASQPPSIPEVKIAQSQNHIDIGQSPTEKSSPEAAHCLQPSREYLPKDENADEGSFTFGEMSFLRAVLRAGNSSHNTPSHEAARIDSRETPMLIDASIVGDFGLRELADFDFSPLKHDSNTSPRTHLASSSMPKPIPPENSIRRDTSSSEDNVGRKTSAPSESPCRRNTPSGTDSSIRRNTSTPFDSSAKKTAFTPSKSAVSEETPNSVQSSRLNNSSPRNVDGTSDVSIPPAMMDKSRSDDLQCQEEEEEEENEDKEENITHGSHISDPSPAMLKPNQSQDPNDFSTQSYNTTPFKSQRSLEVHQLTRSSSAHDDVERCENASNIEEDVMDRIQLQLSQVCPTSPPVAFGEEEDVGNSVFSTTDITEAATIQEPLTHVDSSLKGSAHGSPSIPTEIQRSETDIETEFQMRGSGGITGQPPDEVLEDSWQGCGPQSPWAVELVEPIAAIETVDPSVNALDQSEDNSAKQTDDLDFSDWQHIHSPRIYGTISNQPLKEPAAPRESPTPKELSPPETLTNTQVLVTNPWAASNRKSTATKKIKRVSFGDSPSQNEESQPIQVKFGPASQLSPGNYQGEIYCESRRNSVASAGKVSNSRRFKNILPAIGSSPAHSSPALPAQAEAFIAADQEVAIEQEPSPFLTPSRYLKPRSEMDNNLMWQQQDKPTMLLTSYMRLSSPISPPQKTSIPGFGMEDALGEAGKFLEDWSVDSELKKGKETTKTPESNGYRRRRLFGLV